MEKKALKKVIIASHIRMTAEMDQLKESEAYSDMSVIAEYIAEHGVAAARKALGARKLKAGVEMMANYITTLNAMRRQELLRNEYELSDK